MTLRIRRLDPRAILPVRATPGSAGLDLHALEGGLVYPREQAKIRTGIAVAIPVGWEGQIRGRSGLAFKHQVSITHGVGTIDADYRGELMGLLENRGSFPFEWKAGDRIAQLVISRVEMWDVEEVDELDGTERADGGFGSTGMGAK